MNKIYIGADHAGFALKEKLKRWLIKKKVTFADLGNIVLDKQDDYPDFAEKVARRVAREHAFGVLLCGSAQGMGIAANKVKGIRAVIPSSVKEAALSREHNDANIICLSGWDTPLAKATKMLEVFLKMPFSREARHVRRLRKIRRLER